MFSLLADNSVTYNARWRNTYHAPNKRSVKQDLVKVRTQFTPAPDIQRGAVKCAAERCVMLKLAGDRLKAPVL